MNDLYEVQYTVIQNAKKEIDQLLNQYKLYNNMDLKLDIFKLKEDSCKQILSIAKSNSKDPHLQEVLNDTKEAIDDEFDKVFQNIKSDMLSKSTSYAINKIVNIIQNPKTSEVDDDDEEEEYSDQNYGVFRTQNTAFASLIKNDDDEEEDQNDDEKKVQNVQKKINLFLDNNHDTLLFDKEKLRNISKSQTRLSEILLSLNAISHNPQMKIDNNNEEIPYSYVLYSFQQKKISYVKSLSNILDDNCIFITLYGSKACVRNILTLLTKDNSIKKHDVDDLITIYGPLSALTFADKNIPNSFNMLKNFNINKTNIYIFEISNEGDVKDPLFIKWCQFISFISHISIFCSKNTDINDEIQTFKSLSFVETDTNTLINCSHDKVFQLNFDINSLNEDKLRDSIFQLLTRKIDQFIPNGTIDKFYQIFYTLKSTFDLKQLRNEFEKDRMMEYSYKMLNESREKFNEVRSELFQQLYSLTQKGKLVTNFNLNERKVVNKMIQFFFVNTPKKFWNDSNIISVSRVLASETQKELQQMHYDLEKIESIAKLHEILMSNPNSFPKEAKRILEKLTYEYPDLKAPENSKDISVFKDTLHSLYLQRIDSYFSGQIYENITDSISNEVFSFLNSNPIASNDEYGKFFAFLYQKYSKSPYSSIAKKYFTCVLLIRKVLPIYRAESFDVNIDTKAFQLAKIQFTSTSKTFDIPPSTTCHELYELVRKEFNLGNAPIQITRTVYYKQQECQIAVFDDDAQIAKLKSNSFNVYLSLNRKSTASFLESMIVEKEIIIADDFYIRTSSNDAEFKVKYPEDHKGWFNVVFNIKTPNPVKAFGRNGGALIFLKLSPEEINYLKEGNALVHQSYQGDKWVTEEDSVFLSYPKCNKAVILLRHCSDHRIVPVATNLDSLLPSNKKDENYSRDWEGFNGNERFWRGNKPYYLPVGYIAEGIKVDDFIENTCVAFHGTKAIYVSSIVNEGFKLPSERGGVEEDRIALNKPLFGIPNWGNAVFASPSVKYAALYSGIESIVARTQEHIFVESGHVVHDLIRIIILQVRVNPSDTIYYPNTTPLTPITDNYTDRQMEWRITDTSHVFPYRLLTRDISYQTWRNEYKNR